MNVTGDPAGPPQRAKVYTGDYITALTGWAATMMALWEVKKTGRGQVIDLAQYEAVAQTQGNTHAALHRRGRGLRAHRQSGAGVSALRHLQVQRRLGVHRRAGRARSTPGCRNSSGSTRSNTATTPARRDAAAVNSEKGRELDRRLREYCAARTALEVETELNNAQIGCARVFNMQDQYDDEHYNAREMTVPVLDRQSGVPIRVYGVVPKMSLTPGRIWRGAPSIGDDTTDILAKMLGFSEADNRSPLPGRGRPPHRAVHHAAGRRRQPVDAGRRPRRIPHRLQSRARHPPSSRADRISDPAGGISTIRRFCRVTFI